KKKACKEARGTTLGWYAIGTATTLESNKSLCKNTGQSVTFSAKPSVLQSYPRKSPKDRRSRHNGLQRLFAQFLAVCSRLKRLYPSTSRPRKGSPLCTR